MTLRMRLVLRRLRFCSGVGSGKIHLKRPLKVPTANWARVRTDCPIVTKSLSSAKRLIQDLMWPQVVTWDLGM